MKTVTELDRARDRGAAARRRGKPVATVVDWDRAIAGLRQILDELDEKHRA